MSKLIRESHLQAYENLSQILAPYAVTDIKTKWEQIGSKLLIRNASISNTLYTSAHDFPKCRVMENHDFCFLISQVLGKFRLMKFRTQEEFIPTAWCSSEVDSKPKDCWWKPDNFLKGQHQLSGQPKTSQNLPSLSVRSACFQTKLYLLTWHSELVLSPQRRQKFPARFKQVIIKPSHLDLGHHSDQNICLLRTR